MISLKKGACPSLSCFSLSPGMTGSPWKLNRSAAEVTCFRLCPMLYLNEVSLLSSACPALPVHLCVSSPNCLLGLCKQNSGPKCVLAVTDIPGVIDMFCTSGARETVQLGFPHLLQSIGCLSPAALHTSIGGSQRQAKWKHHPVWF